MPRYYFDLHDNGSAVWDEAGEELAGNAEIEGRARQRLAGVSAKQDASPAPLTLYVIEEGLAVVLTAKMDAAGVVRLIWGNDL